MTDLYDLDDEDREDGEDGDWHDDRDDYREPDPEDADIARAYEEHAEHCDEVHGGGECDCRPSAAARASQAARDIGYWLARPWWRLKAATHRPWTLRIGPAEVTLRLRANHRCDACRGRGWNYSMTPKPEHPIPPGYNGASLCGCGSAIGSLAKSRREMRRMESEPPF